jgi:hypothetical protein
MSRIGTALMLAVLWVGAFSIAQADTRVRVVATDPEDGAALAINQSFYVRLDYASDEPVTLWARPYLNGEQVTRTMTNASEKYSGSGEALGWFALTESGAVDEVRVVAGGGSPYREWEVARRPLALHWGAAAAAEARDASPWVGELQVESAARSREQAKEAASRPVPASDIVMFNGFMLFILAILVAGIAVPVWSVWKWRGGWRVAAGVPVGVLAFVVLRIVVDTAHDPTSHNLWPFEILIFAAIALGITGVLKAARRFMGVHA